MALAMFVLIDSVPEEVIDYLFHEDLYVGGAEVYQDANGTWHPATPCHDFAGNVVEVADSEFEASDIKVGSEVMCFPKEWTDSRIKYDGGLAEYALAAVKYAVLKPANLNLLEAASVPLSAPTAWQALFDQFGTPVSKGQRLLIIGAAGSTGTWAVQFPKHDGAHVVGTTSSEWSKETLKDLGCDKIIDYKTQSPLTDYVDKIDLMLDTVGGDTTLSELTRLLNPGGQMISIVTYDIGQKLSAFKSKFFIWTQNAEQVRNIAKLPEQGQLKTDVDSVYPLEQAAEAYGKGQAGHLKGKVIVEIGREKMGGKM